MAETIFIHSHNDESDRFIILDELDQVAFVYLTEKGSQKPVKDAIAYMRITPPDDVDWKEMAESGNPPILPAELASSEAVINNTKENSFSFKWALDGESAALLYNGDPIAFVSIQFKLGYSKAVAMDNPITNPWDQSIYDQLFTN